MSYKKAVGWAFLLWIIGTASIIFYVIYVALTENQNHAGFFADLSMLSGGFLCAYVMKHEHDISIRDYIRKPDAKTLLLAILCAACFEVAVIFLVYRRFFDPSQAEPFDILDFIGGSVFAPVSEEFTYRFAMLTLLLTASKNRQQKILSVMGTLFAWTIVHFSDYFLRNIDLLICGAILVWIYIRSRNLLYCIVFHGVSNAVIYLFDGAVAEWFFAREYLMYVSLLLTVLFLFLLMHRIYKIPPA